MKKKVNIFGKKISVFVIALFAVAIVSAALISYFGVITGSMTVSQGLKVDGKPWDTTELTYGEDFTSLESKVFASAHRLSNDASVDAEVDLVYDCVTGNCGLDVTTNYYETNLRQGTLTLENKDTSWNILGGDSIKATLNYELVGDEFKYDLTATGLESEVEYVLIYYADQPDRFTNWGGAPALELGRAKAGSEGTFILMNLGVVIPGGLLPYPTDWNAGDEADYCAKDNYEHCRGAKIWLIPSSDYNGDQKVVTWEPTRFLFETDLLGWNHLTGEITESVTVPANRGTVDFIIVSDFPKMLVPDTYTITTTVKPAE